MNMSDDESRSNHVLVTARDLSLGYGSDPLFSGINIDLREGEALEVRGRNGAGKTTLIKAILAQRAGVAGHDSAIKTFSGEISLDRHIRVGIYEQ